MHIAQIVVNLGALFVMTDPIVRQLVLKLIDLNNRYVTARDMLCYYAFGDPLPHSAEPLPITIALPPDATNDEILGAFNRERKKVIDEWRRCMASVYCSKEECTEKALEKAIVSKMNDFIRNYPNPNSSSLENAFDAVISAANEIKVTDADQKDNFDDVAGVEKFVQACYLFCESCQL